MSRTLLVLTLLFLLTLSGCVNSGQRRLGSIVSQAEQVVPVPAVSG